MSCIQHAGKITRYTMQIAYTGNKHLLKTTNNLMNYPTNTIAHLLLGFLVFERAVCDDATHSWKQNQPLKGNMSVQMRST